MEERVQKLLSAAGVCSRRTAETYIAAGRVSINGETAQLGQRADPDRDDIRLDGHPLGEKAAPVYLLLNKPRGYVTTLSDEKGRKTVADLVADCGARVYPVGRLDLDSEGLLLLTNDGALMQYLLHPRHQIDKTYHVTVFGDIRDAAVRLAAVTDLEGEPICPAQVTLLHQSGAGSHHSPGKKPSDPADVRPVRVEGPASAAGPGAYPGTGRPARGNLAAFDRRRSGRAAGGIKSPSEVRRRSAPSFFARLQ